MPPPAGAAARNLVLTLAEGVEYEGVPGVRWVSRFGGSLRRSNEDADIVFFTSAVAASVAPLLEAVRMTPALFGDEAAPWSAMEVATRRWYLFRRYLEAHPEYAGGWVLAIDARDTYFQRDPFAFPRGGGGGGGGGDVLAFLEQDMTIGGSDWNSNVIRACYPAEVLAAIAPHVVSCSGTVLASYAGMLEYLRAMEAEILATAAAPGCLAAGGRDQGFHNVMLYGGALTRRGLDVRLFANDDGPVQTLQFGALYRDAMGRVLNARGELAYIVHQWDRKGDIVKLIDDTMFFTLPEAERVLPLNSPRRRRTTEELRADNSGRPLPSAAPVNAQG